MPIAQEAESYSNRCRALSEIFGPEGALARLLDRYHLRQAQLEMAEAVAEAIAGGRTLVVEAGTGTGKTFAYLVPALLSGRQVIVSTGSRNLQDQLFLKDLPVQVAQLKGRGNYLCHYRLKQVLTADLALPEAARSELAQVRRWVSTTEVGDIAEVSTLAENWWGWQALTATEESCLGKNCPLISDCFVLKARRRAQQADLVVINHHLLCADWALREDGLGEVLGSGCGDRGRGSPVRRDRCPFSRRQRFLAPNPGVGPGYGYGIAAGAIGIATRAAGPIALAAKAG